jgi:putative DNA primase/helicase
MTFRPEDIPEELKEKRRWVNWNFEIRDGKQTKVPKQPNGRNADSTDPGTWSDFEKCLRALDNGSRFKGIGFVFNHDYTGTDFDDCVTNRVITNPDVARLVARLNSYTEYSQSERGLHVINKAIKPGLTCRKSGSKVEM